MLRYGGGSALTPVPSYEIAAWNDLMRVPSDIIGCVVFVGIEAGGTFIPIGTGFIGALPCGPNTSARFLVTARHLLDDHPDAKFSIRLNRRSGGCEAVPLQPQRYQFDDPAIDVVLVPVAISPEIYEFYNVTLDRAEWQSLKDRFLEPGPGDEVAIVGLYTTHHGRMRNLPVVRTGHIAAMPSEPVLTTAGATSAYLVEAHSILGISGSPVFMNVPPFRVENNQPKFIVSPALLIIGVQVGYHLVESKEDQILVPEVQGGERPDQSPRPADSSSPDELRTGLSVVIPIERVFDIMESPMMKQDLQQAYANHLASTRYVRSGASPTTTTSDDAKPAPPSTEGDDQHKERFTALLDAAVGKPKQGG